MAGTIDIVTRAFAGLALSDDPLSFHPHLPRALRRVDFQLHHRGQLLGLSLDHDRLRLTTPAAGPSDPVDVFVDERRVQPPCRPARDIELVTTRWAARNGAGVTSGGIL